MKAISECPICHSRDLEQEFTHYRLNPRGIIGGEVTSQPSPLNGSSCNSCGTGFKFNVKGPCPSCKGSGKYTYVTSRCGISQFSRTTKCPTCNGTGKIE